MKLRTCFLFISSFLSGYVMAADEKIMYGYVEKAILVDHNLTLSAKLDTGAKSASLSAIDIHEVEENGKYYLIFLVPTKKATVQFKAEYLGKVKIKTRVGELQKNQPNAEPIKRPVVMMRIKLGNKIQDIRVNLTNRKRFLYPLLLGRDAIIAFAGIVDPSLAFLIKSEKVEKNEV